MATGLWAILILGCVWATSFIMQGRREAKNKRM